MTSKSESLGRIRDLFAADVTRDIPPVVYFHEQDPHKLALEVDEYIITGGYHEVGDDGGRGKNRLPTGIHECYVSLLRAIARELRKPGGPSLPTCWISGFYGSGKSSFAKLLGLALDGVELPDGRSLAKALLDRDTTPRRGELVDAWSGLVSEIDPMAVVFDIGGVARDGEQVHAVAVRMVQRRLGYCSTDPHVADHELKLERRGEWARFEQVARQTLGKPWLEVCHRPLAEEEFSLVMHTMYPELYSDPMSWFTSRAGTHARLESPNEAVQAIGDMLRFRRPGQTPTLFLVVDEVSQYVLHHDDRTDKLRAFAQALGSGLRGRVWLMALGQQKIDENAGESFVAWAKDRFPPELRVHLATTNIRDVVHRRLLQKTEAGRKQLEALFARHRADLKLFAYGCEDVTPDDFVEIYPLLPGFIELVSSITSELRTRSARSQGDDQAIRGLLQLLGELFRSRRLAERPIGTLITLDEVYEVQHTALDAETQNSMARVLGECAGDASGRLVRVAKVVALLEQIQETTPTTAALVAQCLYDRVDRGNQVEEIVGALDELRRRNLVSYSEKLGYKIQSTAGEEWENERHIIAVPVEELGKSVQAALRQLVAEAEAPKREGRAFPWKALYNDGQRSQDVLLADPRDQATIEVDFRFLGQSERGESEWIKRSGEHALKDRLVWVAAHRGPVADVARELGKSRAMVKRHQTRRESLPTARRHLLDREHDRAEQLEMKLLQVVAAAFMDGQLYFRERTLRPGDMGATFGAALVAAGTRELPEIYDKFVATTLLPSEVAQLLEKDLSGVSPKLVHELKILEIDNGQYVPTCSGSVPRRVREKIEADDGIGGATLLACFGGPPYGYTGNVVRACVAGLLRAGVVKVQTEAGEILTSQRDVGAKELFEKDRAFRRAVFSKAGDEGLSPQTRAKIAKLFEQRFGIRVERDDNAIADVVASRFPDVARELREVLERLGRLPGGGALVPGALLELQAALESCTRVVRQTRPAVLQVKRHIDVLRDGLKALEDLQRTLTDGVAEEVIEAATVRDHHGEQLVEVEALDGDGRAALERIREHLGGSRPWVGIAAVRGDVELVRRAYAVERQRRLDWQGQRVEEARAAIRRRDEFATLGGEKKTRVLAGVARVVTETDARAIAPGLAALGAPFLVALEQAKAEAELRLDELLSQGSEAVIRRVELAEGVRNRVLQTEGDVEGLIEEVRGRLLELVRAGVRVRVT